MSQSGVSLTHVEVTVDAEESVLLGGGGGDDVDIESQSSQAPPASSLSASTIGDQWKAEIAQLQEDKNKDLGEEEGSSDAREGYSGDGESDEEEEMGVMDYAEVWFCCVLP